MLDAKDLVKKLDLEFEKKAYFWIWKAKKCGFHLSNVILVTSLCG